MRLLFLSLSLLRNPFLEMFGHLCKACQVFAQCPAGEYGEEEEGQAGICKEKQELHLCVNTHVDKILDFIAQSLSYVFS